MLIALLVVLGVDLVVVLALALLLVGHNRWLKKQPGAFAGRSGCRPEGSMGSGPPVPAGPVAGCATYWCGTVPR